MKSGNLARFVTSICMQFDGVLYRKRRCYELRLSCRINYLKVNSVNVFITKGYETNSNSEFFYIKINNFISKVLRHLCKYNEKKQFYNYTKC